MIFYACSKKYISCVLTFIKINSKNYNDENVLKTLGVNKIKRLITKEEILDDNMYPKVCFLDINEWVAIIEDFYGLYNIQCYSQIDKVVPYKEVYYENLSKTYNEIFTIGFFSEVSDAFVFQYYNNGKLVRNIDYETMDVDTKVSIKNVGFGNPLKKLPEIFDFRKPDTYLKTVISNFGIDLKEDISEGRFYSIE